MKQCQDLESQCQQFKRKCEKLQVCGLLLYRHEYQGNYFFIDWLLSLILLIGGMQGMYKVLKIKVLVCF